MTSLFIFLAVIIAAQALLDGALLKLVNKLLKLQLPGRLIWAFSALHAALQIVGNTCAWVATERQQWFYPPIRFSNMNYREVECIKGAWFSLLTVVPNFVLSLVLLIAIAKLLKFDLASIGFSSEKMAISIALLDILINFVLATALSRTSVSCI